MHIPDGYLSPSTCIAAYAVVAPCWAVALRRVERRMQARTVPLLAVFAAFSFVLMMFNLPLPGGTTGHAVGMGVAAVVLGPWAGMLAVSVALAIQALFFGDGGISTLGANCLNMGVIGVGSAYLLYRLLAGGATIASPRRVVAAALAGYGAINLSALATAVEFGVQPLWFHTETGVPLYAPYPLAIAVPAMMIGHLSIAGAAEAFVSGGLVSWLQRSQPELLRATAGAVWSGYVDAVVSLRRLFVLLGSLMVLAPLGQLATGTAWGEWGAGDFADVQARQEIAAASGGQAPTRAPEGLERLGRLWRAPIPDYDLPFLPASLGYACSAIVGGGLSLLLSVMVGAPWRRREH